MALSIGIARAALNPAERCGDAAHAWQMDDGRAVIAIADGLGHGAEAAHAADTAMAYVGGHLALAPLELVAGLHEALAATRGAAIAVAYVDPLAGRLTHVAVGNIRAGIFGWRTSRLDSYPGVVGSGYRRLQPTEAPLRRGDVLVLWTDGVDERLSLPADSDPDAAALAGQLLQAYSHGGDDSCVVVARLDAA
ncbi:MAG: SpoIIE family protein phosphatase [Bacteroidales bacterium]